MTLGEYELLLRNKFRNAQVDAPDLCARILVAHASGLSRLEYILARDKELSPERANYLLNLAARRAAGEPLAYLLGKKEFYGYEFFIDSSTLIPRPETELIVETALSLPLPETSCIADLCCGSGCIGISILNERPAWNSIFMDLSITALHICKKNLCRYGHMAPIVQGDIFTDFFLQNTFHLIVANPPYISPQAKADVMRETYAFEPHMALFSDRAGLSHLQRIIEVAKYALMPGGFLVFEHGFDQRRKIRQMLIDENFENIILKNDLANLPRYAIAKKPGALHG